MPPTALCPRCAMSFDFLPPDQGKDPSTLNASMAPGFDAHVATCLGTFNISSPDGKGWTTPNTAWADPNFWSDPNHPAKRGQGAPAKPRPIPGHP